jgi:hypothetical protein
MSHDQMRSMIQRMGGTTKRLGLDAVHDFDSDVMVAAVPR